MASPETSLSADVALCQCGCGEPVKMADRTRNGIRRGEPLRFAHGHNARRAPHAYEINTETGCWQSTRTIGPDGYAKARCPRLKCIRPAHVIAWERATGRTAPDRYEVHHRCENRGCVNPDHLILLHESEHKWEHSRLTREQVRTIRTVPRTYGSGRALAKRYGVSAAVIFNIRSGVNWTDA